MILKKDANEQQVKTVIQQTTKEAPESAIGSDKAGRSGAPSLRYPEKDTGIKEPTTPKTSEDLAAEKAAKDKAEADALNEKAKEDEAARVKAEAEAKAEQEAAAKAESEKAKAEQEAKDKEAADAKAKADAEQAKIDADNKAKLEAEAAAKAKEEADAKAEQEAKDKEAADAAKAEQEAKDKEAAEAAAKAKEEADAKAKADEEQAAKDKAAEDEKVASMNAEDRASYLDEKSANEASKKDSTVVDNSDTVKDADGNNSSLVEVAPEPKVVIKLAMNDALIQQTTENDVLLKNFRYRSRPSTTALKEIYVTRPAWGGKYPADESKNFNAIYIDDIEFAMAPIGYNDNSTTSVIYSAGEDGVVYYKQPIDSTSGSFYPNLQFALSLSSITHRETLSATDIDNYTFGFEVTDANKEGSGFTGTVQNISDTVTLVTNYPDRNNVIKFPQQRDTSTRAARPLQCYPSFLSISEPVVKATFPANEIFIPYYATKGPLYSENRTVDANYAFNGTDKYVKSLGLFNIRMYVTDKRNGKTYEAYFKIHHELAVKPTYYQARAYK